jgi:hypothetical protein
VGTIGSPPAHVFPNIINIDTIKREIIRMDFDTGTHFIPAIVTLENYGVFDTRETKYVFVFTDGMPEPYDAPMHFNPNTQFGRQQQQPQQISTTLLNTEVEGLIYYMKNRWVADQTVEYFWIQLTDLDINFLDWVTTQTDYVPPREQATEFTDAQYNHAKNARRNTFYTQHSVYKLWGEWMWQCFKEKNVMFLSVKDMLSGIGIHNMIDYFMFKFKRRIK